MSAPEQARRELREFVLLRMGVSSSDDAVNFVAAIEALIDAKLAERQSCERCGNAGCEWCGRAKSQP